MVSKTNSAGNSKKSKPSSSDGSAMAPDTKQKSLKVPKLFIIRPSVSSSIKGTSRVYLHRDIVAHSDDITEGSLVYLNKEGEINGIMATVATFSEFDHNVIQISTSLRKLGGLLLGDRIAVRKATKQPAFADSVSIATENGELLYAASQKGVEKILDDIGLIYPGMVLADCMVKSEEDSEIKISKNLRIVDVTHSIEEKVENLTIDESTAFDNQPLYSPPFIFKRGLTKVQFTVETSFSRSKYPAIPIPITYDSLGGLKTEAKLLKSTVELPLHKSELFAQFGISPPRGILLHGPPGTGKTMILRAVANETDAHVLTIDGPSIVGKYLGETEGCIREIFIEARKYQPSIIIIDEVDSLAPNRNSDDSGEVESRVVATLLTLMDGMGDAGRVVVIGATNRPNSVDAALRRPGRFDQEIEIGIPDVEARLSILKLQFDKMQRHSLTEGDISEIASRTHGFVGADLVALCRESVMKTIQRSLESNDNTSKVSIDDVESGLLDIRPSAMREIFLEMPKVYWHDIGGQEVVKQKLKEMVQLPLEAAETFKKLGIRAPKGLLLYGPPGCSKTLTAKALATESKLNFLAVKGPEIFNKYVGESEKSIREIFRKARAAAPSIIFFDEIDAISQDRSDGDSPHTTNQVLTTLLNEIDGVEELNGVVIVAATNRPDSIDAALLRPGRLDRHIYVSPPDFDARLQILKNTCSKFNLQDVLLEEFAEATEGCSGAEVSLLAQEAGLAAIMEDKNAAQVRKKHFEAGLKGLNRGITPEMLQYYKDFAAKSGVSV